MTSELRTVADNTRAFTAQADPMIAGLSGVTKSAADLTRQAVDLSRAGVDTRELSRLLDGATTDANTAGKAVTEFTHGAEAFAARLAGGATRSGGMASLAGLMHAVPGSLVTIAMMASVLGPAWSALSAVDGTLHGDTEPGTELVARQAAGDINDAARDPDYEPKAQVTEPDQADHRPPPTRH